MEKNITLEIDGSEIHFTVTADVYNKYLNEFQPTNKVAPSHSLLMRTVDDDSRDALKDELKKPGAALMIVGCLVEEYQPDLNITVGKPKTPPNK